MLNFLKTIYIQKFILLGKVLQQIRWKGKYSLIVLLFIVFDTQAQKVVRVAVAANLAVTIEEIADKFEEKYEGVDIQIITASSGKLTAQIRNGAPFHIFISANQIFPSSLYKEGYCANLPQIIAYGQLAFWSKREMQESQIKAQLLQNQIRRVAIAQPEIAPFGEFAKKWLIEQNLFEGVQQKLVYGESVGKVNQYIFTQTVDFAITSNSAKWSKKLSEKGYWINLSQYSNYKIPQSMVLLKKGEKVKEASLFKDFLKSDVAQGVFREFGYLVE